MRKGFTLIEIAIVLVIIGIIIGAIMKGRDLIREAQRKRFAQTYAMKWKTLMEQMVGDGIMDQILGTSTNISFALSDNASYNTVKNLMEVDLCTVLKSKAKVNIVGANICPDGTTPWGGVVRSEAVGGGYAVVYVGYDRNTNRFYLFAVPAGLAQGIDTWYDDGRPNSGDIVAAQSTCYDTANATNQIYTPATFPNIPTNGSVTSYVSGCYDLAISVEAQPPQ